jgi:hypothetical protein
MGLEEVDTLRGRKSVSKVETNEGAS